MKRTFVKAIYAGMAVTALSTMLVSCHDDDTVSGSKPIAGEYLLPMIETTDIHGYIVNATSAGDVHYKLAYIADKVADIRGRGEAYNKEALLLLDCGDLYQGNTISNIQQGVPIDIAIDRMRYDAVAVGNHEFDWGFENIVEPDATLRDYEYNGQQYANMVPVTCANLYRNGVRASNTKDYVILEKKAMDKQGNKVKVKIGVVGFADDWSSSIMVAEFADKGYSIRKDFSIANSIASELEQSGQCDATILLVHGAADKMAQKLGSDTPFDIVLGGHTHVNISGETEWGLPYLQATSYGEAYAYTQLKFCVDDNGRVSFSSVVNTDIVDVDTAHDTHTQEGENAEDLDSDILAVSDAAIGKVESILSTVVGHINVDATNNYPDVSLSIPGSDGRASVMANWMCDIYRTASKADVAFVNSGGVRTSFVLNGAPTRDITISNIYDIFPFGNNLYLYQITYAELLQLFDYALTNGGHGLLSRVTGIDCYFTKKENVSDKDNNYYTYAVHSLVKDGITIYENGTWTDDWASRTLKVVTNNFTATTDRVDSYTNMHNPMVSWNDTPRLIISNIVDNENALRVLKAEAVANEGLLSIDAKPHFILYTE